MLLAEHHAVTGDTVVAKDLEPAARAAVAWMLDDGGMQATGYLRYRTDGPGLVHHCWKDSADSIVFADGPVAAGPIAVSEAQGYAYRALRGTAELARSAWGDPTWAAELDRRADRLRAMFSADFRLPNAFVALALDGADRQVDALASNAGHVLWSGILDDSWAALVAERLAEDDFFSGWGIRTLAEGQPPYHPLSYHRGGVWPHDTALAVAGLAGAGHTAAAARIAEGLVAAASTAGGRLPEVLTGLARRPGQAAGPLPALLFAPGLGRGVPAAAADGAGLTLVPAATQMVSTARNSPRSPAAASSANQVSRRSSGIMPASGGTAGSNSGTTTAAEAGSGK